MKKINFKISILVLAVGMFANNVMAQVQDTVNATKVVKPTKYQLHEYGLVIIAIIAALAIFAIIFFYINHKKKKNEPEEIQTNESQIVTIKEVDKEIEGEVHAAIALALHLHNREVHDFENLILTINRVSRNYSPWSSKIYSLRQWPVRK